MVLPRCGGNPGFLNHDLVTFGQSGTKWPHADKECCSALIGGTNLVRNMYISGSMRLVNVDYRFVWLKDSE